MNNQDKTLYNKAKRRVIFHLFLAWVLLICYFVGVYYVLNLDFLKIYTNTFNEILLISSVAQLCMFALLFFLLSFGKKIFRIFYWLGFILTLFLFYIPIHYALDDMAHIITYATLAGFMFIKVMFLVQLGKYLKNNSWSRIYFDWIVDIYPDHPVYEPPIQEVPKTIQKPIEKQPIYETYEEKYYEEPIQEKEPYTKPQVSLRLGICIYASLMVFPILVQIFSRFFSSYDLQTVFATKDIFMFCIFTALIWTIPVFYLYYDHALSKRIVLICLILEALCTVLYLPKFFGYMTSTQTQYPIRVFILFALVDILRYACLLWSIKPLKEIE